MGVTLPDAKPVDVQAMDLLSQADTADANENFTSFFVSALAAAESAADLSEDESWGDNDGPLLPCSAVEEYGRLCMGLSPHHDPQGTVQQCIDHIHWLGDTVPGSLKAAVEQVGLRSNGDRMVVFFLTILTSPLMDNEEDEENDNVAMEEEEEEEEEEDESEEELDDDTSFYLSLIE